MCERGEEEFKVLGHGYSRTRGAVSESLSWKLPQDDKGCWVLHKVPMARKSHVSQGHSGP